MSKRKRLKQFCLVLVDEDKRVFNVIGSVSDDRDWINKIAELKETGRKVTYSIDHDTSIRNVAGSFSKRTGYTYSLILFTDEPEDSSSDYMGAIPQYTQSANRKKLVKVLCKGQCATASWAEMNVKYPGPEVLKNAVLGTFTATCLKCGKIAKDSYNWYR